MNLPGFTADLTLGAANAYRMVAAFQEMGGTVRAAQFDGVIEPIGGLGPFGGLEPLGGIEPLAGTCAATTECGDCVRICAPRLGCRSFRICCCTTKGGRRKCTTQAC